METVIEQVALRMIWKEEQNAKRKRKELYKDLRFEIQEGIKSPLLMSLSPDRQKERREAVSERNVRERTLVKKTLKRLIQEDHVHSFSVLSQ